MLTPAGAIPPQDDWERHWDDYAESAQHNPAQCYRRRLVLQRLGTSPARVLDIGSGQGDLVKEIIARFPGAEVIGLEASRSGVEISARKNPTAVFIQRDLLDPSKGAGEYAEWASHAVCSEVLEHVDDPVLLLRQCQLYMSPGCRLVVTVPGGPMSAFDRHIGHRGHYSASKLTGVLESSGFVVEKVACAGFPFFNVYRLMVILRGQRLVDDVAAGRYGTTNLVGRMMMTAFRALFRLNLGSSPWGWQLIATARRPGGA